MTVGPTITLGAILNFAGIVGIGLVYMIRTEGKINSSLRVGKLEDAVKALTKTDRRLAVIEERISNHSKIITTAQQGISGLRRGGGFISSRRESIDGEYLSAARVMLPRPLGVAKRSATVSAKNWYLEIERTPEISRS
jgi:hypothetical protein